MAKYKINKDFILECFENQNLDISVSDYEKFLHKLDYLEKVVKQINKGRFKNKEQMLSGILTQQGFTMRQGYFNCVI